MCCWGQYPWVYFVSLAVTLDSTETPFAKTPFSWFLIFELFVLEFKLFGAITFCRGATLSNGKLRDRYAV